MNDEDRRHAANIFAGDSFFTKLVDISLRLPPLYVMDAILLYNMGIWTEPSLIPEIANTEEGNITEQITNSTDLYQTFSKLYGGNPLLLVLPHVARFLLCTICYLGCMLLFLLQTSQLLVFYRYMVCVLVIPASYMGHKMMADSLQPLASSTGTEESLVWQYLAYQWPSHIDSQLSRSVAVNYLVQSSLALLLKRIMEVSGRMSETLKYLTAVMILPCVLALLSVPPPYLALSAFVANILPAALLGTSLGQQSGKVWAELVRLYTLQRDFINNFGLNTYLEAEWIRLRVPTVLRSFWLSRMLLLLLLPPTSFSLLQSISGLFELAKSCLVRGSETVTAVLGMTSVVASLSHWFGAVFQVILKTDDDEEKSVASVSAVLFFVLALQTGLTGMESEKRFHQICKNLCLLLTAILHFVHSMVQPVLMSLSASRNTNRSIHVRALSICLFLAVSPVILLCLLWQNFNMGTWLLAVTAFCIEVVVKVFVTTIIYALFMWDAFYQDGIWEGLDDWVYYIRAFGNSVEFIFAVFLFLNGGWILMFESGGTIRAVMMLIHAYFNIWCEAKNGWSTFIKRRTAVAKINSLDEATLEDIMKHNDVCAICYQEMIAAKLTRCHHMFHAICLRKWLYMQDNCPMCHERLYKTDATSQTDMPPPPPPVVQPQAPLIQIQPMENIIEENNLNAMLDDILESDIESEIYESDSDQE